MKRTTKKTAHKLDREIARLIQGIYGAVAEIAAIGAFSRTYAWKVVHGQKPASLRFLLAVDCFLAGASRRVNGAMLRRAHPELDERAQA
jgi:hypothetical protein